MPVQVVNNLGAFGNNSVQKLARDDLDIGSAIRLLCNYWSNLRPNLPSWPTPISQVQIQAQKAMTVM